MKTERTFVRNCQSGNCGVPFASGERECQMCGRHRAQRCWTIGIYGAFCGQDIAVEDSLDRVFNNDVFIGRVRGQVFYLSDHTWSLTEPVFQLGADAPPQDGTVAITMALEAARLEVRTPRSTFAAGAAIEPLHAVLN